MRELVSDIHPDEWSAAVEAEDWHEDDGEDGDSILDESSDDDDYSEAGGEDEEDASDEGGDDDADTSDGASDEESSDDASESSDDHSTPEKATGKRKRRGEGDDASGA